MSVTRTIWLGLLAVLVAVTATSPQAIAQQQKPNILFNHG